MQGVPDLLLKDRNFAYERSMPRKNLQLSTSQLNNITDSVMILAGVTKRLANGSLTLDVQNKGILITIGLVLVWFPILPHRLSPSLC